MCRGVCLVLMSHQDKEYKLTLEAVGSGSAKSAAIFILICLDLYAFKLATAMKDFSMDNWHM